MEEIKVMIPRPITVGRDEAFVLSHGGSGYATARRQSSREGMLLRGIRFIVYSGYLSRKVTFCTLLFMIDKVVGDGGRIGLRVGGGGGGGKSCRFALWMVSSDKAERYCVGCLSSVIFA